MEKEAHLTDWLTSEAVPFATKLTSSDDRILHNHSFYEFFYITKGHIKHKLNDEESLLQTGDLLFINLTDKHIFLRERERENECEHRDIVVPTNLLKEICQNISPVFYSNLIQGKITNRINLSANTLKEFEIKCNNIAKISLKNPETAVISAKFFIYEILSLLYNKTLLSERVSYPDWFSQLLERFNDINLLKAGLNEIISPFYFSTEHICRVFKKYTNMTMTDYLNQRKIFEAANMLMYSNDSINEICNKLGITSASYFNKLFKIQYHTTPLKFRKQSTIK